MKNDIKITEEGVLIMTDSENNPVGLVRKDMATRHNVFYTLTMMDMQEIEGLFNKK